VEIISTLVGIHRARHRGLHISAGHSAADRHVYRDVHFAILENNGQISVRTRR
jgi:hypothetical protein